VGAGSDLLVCRESCSSVSWCCFPFAVISTRGAEEAGYNTVDTFAQKIGYFPVSSAHNLIAWPAATVVRHGFGPTSFATRDKYVREHHV
jgi:hypothetical protein